MPLILFFILGVVGAFAVGIIVGMWILGGSQAKHRDEAAHRRGLAQHLRTRSYTDTSPQLVREPTVLEAEANRKRAVQGGHLEDMATAELIRRRAARDSGFVPEEKEILLGRN